VDENDEDIEILPFPSKRVVVITLICSFCAAFMALVSSLWQHSAAVATKYSTLAIGYGNISTATGAGPIVLGWIATTLLMLLTIGMFVMLVSMIILDSLV